jgi:2-polyprenyl-3-methyl-5-hydroxy-6-metoxy-1,4-benzoquinol methylase
MKRALNILRALVQMRGPKRMKESLWNKEFANGRWDYLDHTTSDYIYPLLHTYIRGGRILDLGCGSGNTGNELQDSSYSGYLGVDISSVAVEKARQRSQAEGRGSKNQYVTGEITSFTPECKFDVILFRESLFYVPRAEIVPTLRRYQQHLTPSGVFMVRMYDRVKYSDIISTIQTNFTVTDRVDSTEAGSVILIFR